MKQLIFYRHISKWFHQRLLCTFQNNLERSKLISWGQCLNSLVVQTKLVDHPTILCYYCCSVIKSCLLCTISLCLLETRTGFDNSQNIQTIGSHSSFLTVSQALSGFITIRAGRKLFNGEIKEYISRPVQTIRTSRSIILFFLFSQAWILTNQSLGLLSEGIVRSLKGLMASHQSSKIS